ncbi:MAG: hypothetical protein C4522_08020 [Desulfobacteraceae bacterium]|nr:MAG: hypothetical protein C4522_08020 [Desulfobacteraceae bacterium]
MFHCLKMLVVLKNFGQVNSTCTGILSNFFNMVNHDVLNRTACKVKDKRVLNPAGIFCTPCPCLRRLRKKG